VTYRVPIVQTDDLTFTLYLESDLIIGRRNHSALRVQYSHDDMGHIPAVRCEGLPVNREIDDRRISRSGDFSRATTWPSLAPAALSVPA